MKRKNDGYHTTVVRAVPVRQALLDANVEAPCRKALRPPELFSGPKPRLVGRAVKEPDWVVLHVRWLREFRGLSNAAIREHMEQLGIQLDLARVNNMVHYQTRAYLVPSDTDQGYIPHMP